MSGCFFFKFHCKINQLIYKRITKLCEKGSYSLSNWMHLTVRCVTLEYGTSLKFSHLTLLTWFYSWEQFYINRLNALCTVTFWSWKLRKAIRPLFADPVTIVTVYFQWNILTWLFSRRRRQEIHGWRDGDCSCAEWSLRNWNDICSFSDYRRHHQAGLNIWK